ncbi:hypothetical protein RB597_000566 [Gaeumannomyces tritici]
MRSTPRAFERRAAQDRQTIRTWFDSYAQTVAEKQVKLENTWNSDETGFRVGVFEGRFVWCYCDIETLFQSDPDHRALVTVTETCSAAGQTIPPFIIMAGVNLSVKHIMNSLESGTRLCTSENGWTDDLIALDWLKHFIEHTKPAAEGEYRLLLIDNHGSHLTFPFWQRCEAARIILFPLPPHTTHKLQPLDVGVFSAYKAAHQRDLGRQIEAGAVDYDRVEFLDGLKNMRRRAFKVSTLKSAWAKCGLAPFDPDVVLDNLEDPLTSAKSAAVITRKVGYIPNASEQQRSIERRAGFLSSVFDDDGEPSLFRPFTTPSPPLLAQDWANVATPSLDLKEIIPLEDWLEDRLYSLVDSGRPPSPRMIRVFSKIKKASHAAILAGATAIESLRRHREEEVARKQRNSFNRLVTKIGPITVDDARLRAINDEGARLALQRKERNRLRGKDLKTANRLFRRWLRDYKRAEIKRLKQKRAGMRADGARRKDITNECRTLELGLKNESFLIAKYWQQRRERHNRYHELYQVALADARAQSVRPNDVSLPPNWQPAELLEPYTPWQMTARDEGTVRKVIRFFWREKYGPSRPFDVALPGLYTEETFEISSPECTDNETGASTDEASDGVADETESITDFMIDPAL